MPKNLFFDKHKNFFAVFFLLIGTFLYSYHLNFFAKFPGDNLDARFNHFVLEYFYSVLIGKNESFIQGNFFYALPNTMNLSDNHWLLAPFYSLLRILGLNEIKSYQIWVYFGFMANYLVCLYVFKKFKFNPLACAIGAYLFSFNQIHFEKITHIQLNLKIFIILGIWYFKRYIDTKNFKYASYIFLCFTLQLICNAYTGNFFMILMLALILIFFSNYKIHEYKKFIPQKLDFKITVPIFILSALILGIWAYPYYQTMQIYNLNKPIIITNLEFKFFDLLTSDSNIILAYLVNFFELNSLKNYGENLFFIGFIPWFVLIYLFLNKKLLKSLNQFEKILLKSTIFLLIFFSLEKYFSLFNLIQIYIKSFTNLRAYSRFFYVIFFTFIYFCTFVIHRFKFQNNWKYLQILILILATLEPFFLKNNNYSVNKIQEEYQEIKYKFIDKNIQSDSIIFLVPNTGSKIFEYIKNQILMMHLANELGVKTINGYSSFNPLSLINPANCGQLFRIYDENEKIISKITKKEFKYNQSNLIVHCEL